MTSLVVHLNRGELYDVEPVATSFQSTGPFEVELRNHGQAVHAHLRLDEDLSRVASLNGPNHFVDTDSVTTVQVAVADGAPSVRGMLKVVTGYGSGTDYVEVHVSDEADEGVAIGDAVRRPEPTDGNATGEQGAAGVVQRATGYVSFDVQPFTTRVDSGRVLAVVGLGVLVLAVFAVAAVTAPGLAAVFGIFAVLVGVAVSAYVLVQ